VKFSITYESSIVPGFMEVAVKKHLDERGSFHRYYCGSELSSVLNSNFNVAQINISNSLKKGTFRGFHYQDNPMRERKIITATSGSFLDVVINIDIRSPNFGKYDWRKFSANEGNIVVVSKSCAHAILSLEDNSVAVYLSDTPYTPELERGICVLDENINFPRIILDQISLISEKDRSFPPFILHP
jgi:dTDP-4-dehydrorhamnose 3,5-epimerase